MSTTITSLPRSARHAAVVSPTYPAPMTATLLTATRLCQQGLIGRDRLPRGPVPAELPSLLQSGPPPSIGLADHRCGCIAKRPPVTVLDHHPRGIDNFRDAGIPKRGHRAAAGHRLEAREAESFVPARKQQAARRRVQISELLIVHPAKLDGARHARRRLTARRPRNQQPEVRMRDSSGGPGVQQSARILTRVKRANEKQVASVDPPLDLHPPRSTRLWTEDRIGRLADEPDPLRRDDSEVR